MQTFVIKKTLSRWPFRASPIHCSLRCSLYSQALSKKLIPASIASWAMCMRLVERRGLADMISADAENRDLVGMTAKFAHGVEFRSAGRGALLNHAHSIRREGCSAEGFRA